MVESPCPLAVNDFGAGIGDVHGPSHAFVHHPVEQTGGKASRFDMVEWNAGQGRGCPFAEFDIVVDADDCNIVGHGQPGQFAGIRR